MEIIKQSRKSTEESNETKSWFFEMIKKIIKLLARLRNKQRGFKLLKSGKEKGDITTNLLDIYDLQRNTTNNCMQTNKTTLMKWAIS